MGGCTNGASSTQQVGQAPRPPNIPAPGAQKPPAEAHRRPAASANQYYKKQQAPAGTTTAQAQPGLPQVPRLAAIGTQQQQSPTRPAMQPPQQQAAQNTALPAQAPSHGLVLGTPNTANITRFSDQLLNFSHLTPGIFDRAITLSAINGIKFPPSQTTLTLVQRLLGNEKCLARQGELHLQSVFRKNGKLCGDYLAVAEGCRAQKAEGNRAYFLKEVLGETWKRELKEVWVGFGGAANCVELLLTKHVRGIGVFGITQVAILSLQYDI